MKSRTVRIAAFMTTVMTYHREHGRHTLPWRQTHDPYAILVSEMMLQQTQVDRVIPYYGRFLERFPTAKSLAAASLADVLTLWSGLGYNRRAKFLYEAGRVIAMSGMPKTAEKLRDLPGVGPYTACAIAAFAYDQREVVIETNIRAALIHHFFHKKENIADGELVPLLEKMVSTVASPREWYGALMDYGTHVKATHGNPARKSKQHVVQSKFEGSLRQVRGKVLQLLTLNISTEKRLVAETGVSAERVHEALLKLQGDGLVRLQRGQWGISR